MAEGYDVSITDLGADPTGKTDCSEIINNALQNYAKVYMPSGTYLLTNSIQVTYSSSSKFLNNTLIGSGINTTVLTVQSLNLTGIYITVDTSDTLPSIPSITISNFKLTRTNSQGTVPVAPNLAAPANPATNLTEAAGILCGQNLNYYFENLNLNYHYNGFQLGSTNGSYVETCLVENCSNNGFYITNDSTASAIQWSLINTISQNNLNCGYYVIASPYSYSGSLSPPITLNPWFYPYTFGNGS